MIPFSRATLGQEEKDAVARVIDSGWLAAGKETEAFEQEFSTYISPEGVDKYYCIFTNSCTSALKIAYKWAKEQNTGTIFYPLNTFCATYSAASEAGLDTLARENVFGLLLPSDVYTATRVNMHWGGVKDETPCLIEDSAHRIEPNDPLVGKIRCYSFYATKNMTTGSGGMFVTNDKDIYDFARLQWRDGLTTSTADRDKGFTGYRVEALAGGYDGNDLAAALGRVQLRHLPEFTQRRNEIVAQYNAGFGQAHRGNHLYPLMVADEAEVYECIAFMRDKGIACSHHYPGTGWNGVSLPLYPTLTDSEVQQIIDAGNAWKARSV
jgi:dTDP-4-amino-4,6-dideoxygalactose transaminase